MSAHRSPEWSAFTAANWMATNGRGRPFEGLGRHPRRRSFTLVEMLTVVTVIGILASSILFALFNATREAKIARTKSQVQRLHQLLMTRWETYRTRPIRINTTGLNAIGVATKRLNALHELMRLEMPERINDVLDPATYTSPNGLPFPALARHYWRVSSATTWANTGKQSYYGAECLYMIVASIQENGTAGLDFLQPGEIGDVDDDGMPEILDAWGHPIEFLRWAPGFVPQSTIMNTGTPDPFDPLKVNSGTFALYPLIYSPGPDGKYDITVEIPAGNFNYSTSGVDNNPYYTPSAGDKMGTPADTNADGETSYSDNITNHFAEAK